MTQFGKCDRCRQRKIKCDEKHPVCGRCEKTGQTCHYSFGKAHQFVDGRQKSRAVLKDSHDASEHASASSPSDWTKTTTSGADSSSKPGLALRLKSTRAASSGSGLFQTLKPMRAEDKSSKSRSGKRSDHDMALVDGSRRQPSPLAEPLSAATTLLNRWMSLTEALSNGYDTPYILGTWMEFIPQRIGHSDAIDSAVDCFLNSSIAYVNCTDSNKAMTDRANMKAIQNIRTAILAADSDLPCDEALLAISLLHLVELFVRASSGEYRYHQTGLLNLVQRVSKQGTQCNEITKSIFFDCLAWDSFPAIIQNRNSIFDEPSWLTMPPRKLHSRNKELSHLETIQEYGKKHWIIMPRIVRLVRRAYNFPEDTKARTEATELAAKLYSDDLESWIQELLDKCIVKIDPTTTPEYQSFIEKSFRFKSWIAFAGLTNYWTLRIRIYGLIFTLMDLVPMTSLPYVFDKSTVAMQDIQAAKCIAMSVEYSMSSPTTIPLNTIRMLAPLKASFETWHRLEIRAGGESSTSADAQFARRMKGWCMKLSEDIGKKWGTGTMTDEQVLRQHDILIGKVGPRVSPA